MIDNDLFVQRVYDIVTKVPKGQVITYGIVALMAGIPRAAQQVGWIAHWGPTRLPWQRVVNRFGGLASGYPGDRQGHKVDLEKEGIEVQADMTVDLAKYLWRPSAEEMKALELPFEVIAGLNEKIPFSSDKLSW